MALGTVVSLPFSGILADAFGWEAVFYVQGGLAMIWCVLWVFLVYDSPQDHPRIHPKELELFESCMEDGGHGHAVSPRCTVDSHPQIQFDCIPSLYAELARALEGRPVIRSFLGYPRGSHLQQLWLVHAPR